MNFPPINAVDDGVFVFVGWSLFSGYYGVEIWNIKYTFFGMSRALNGHIKWLMIRLMPLYGLIAMKNIYINRHSDHM